MFNKNQKNKAFTLIEVLVVTAVISLVASIVNAQLGEARQKADDAHMKTEVQQVRNAVEQYRQKTGTVPVNVGSYSSTGTYKPGEMAPEGSDEYRDAMNELVIEGFMPEVPTSPNGQSYSYLATEDGGQAVFAATLNNEDSGSNTNSCDVVDSITVTNCLYDWGYCDEVTYDSSSQLLYCEVKNNDDEGNLSEACDYSNLSLDNNCNGEVLIDELPQDACDLPYEDYGGGYCGRPLGAYYMLCDYTGDKAVCDGFNDSDYCSCI